MTALVRQPRALLLGGPGRYPFNGHLRLVIERGAACLHLAGTVAAGSEPPVAWAAARALRRQLAKAEGRDRFGLLRSAWELLAAVDLSTLGPAHGDDLALVMVAEDGRGIGIAGTGLAALYALDAQAVPLIEPDHPLFGIRGIPATPPGVFTPHVQLATVVAAAASGALDPTERPSWQQACGLGVLS